ncbi:hypothetical protein BpHYR1_006095 [Brachionus plicatilis]|uniref:Uncharacterized protein n=1 Tax=Brachionus plicatilis TaxID=10195 RepID=A0A3M7SFI9_BRAPC|nr:hypothetical protein BpHYR1_006095 [Brachionus plicatilis]
MFKIDFREIQLIVEYLHNKFRFLKRSKFFIAILEALEGSGWSKPQHYLTYSTSNSYSAFIATFRKTKFFLSSLKD